MDRNARIEILLGSAHLDSDAEALEHLARSQTHDMQPDDLFLGASADDLVLGGGLVGRVHHGVVHGREGGLVDLDVLLAVLLDGLRFRQTDGADLGVREHHARDIAVVYMRVCEDLRRAVQALG